MKRPSLKLSSICDNLSKSACAFIGTSPFAHSEQIRHTSSRSADLFVSMFLSSTGHASKLDKV